jgi:phosphohistidine phosphatase SixA
MMKRKCLFAALCGFTLVCISAHAADIDWLVEQIKTGGHVLMIRHAYAPGNGDPENFRIGDCTTQRNLDDRGRSQARRIGQWLAQRGVQSARVYASQWCRCLETAQGLGLGPVAELPALNSFYERPQDREPNLTALKAFLAQQPADGKLIVLVTHYVTISSLTDQGMSAGEGVVMRLNGAGGFEVLGRLEFDL